MRRRWCWNNSSGWIGVLAGMALAAQGVAQVAVQVAAQQTPVILISIDTLRADHLSAYGYRTIHTPGIDSFADSSAGSFAADSVAHRGTLFANAESQIPLTLPSHLSLFTSTYPFANQIEENAERVPEGVVTLASVLRSHGYQTAAFVGCVFLERQIGIGQGFDLYDSPFNFPVLSPLSGSMLAGTRQNQYTVRDRRDGALVTSAASRWLAAHRGQPAFVFVHLFDMHKPYHLPASFHPTPSVSGYDAELEYVDHLMGSFRQTLMDQGWWDRSLVVLLADHGESLGEHSEDSHGTFIYQSTLHVPLIFHWPADGFWPGGAHGPAGAPDQPAVVSQSVGLIDVAPTVLDFLHVLSPPSFAGRSLMGEAGTGRTGFDLHPVYAESLHTHDAFGWAPLRSLRDGDFKYIEAPTPELYDLRADPNEHRNLARVAPLGTGGAQAPSQALSKALEMKGQLAQFLARYGPARPAPARGNSPETQARLRSLGYLAPGSRPALSSDGPDPKDRLPEFRLYESAQAALYQGRIAEATAMLLQVLARDPNNTLARRDLGGCYVERRMWNQARAAFERVLERAPEDYVTHFELGIAEEHLGLLKEAREDLETACRIAPEASQCRHELDTLGQDNPPR
ncbi:MAG TPA: sulfatase-like hydrolase/transferase [Candidatus Acidoferrales bacterium]|nr:sulfatase-like hydrolase/transferase [Candidatus Acidoferrales bacterium]